MTKVYKINGKDYTLKELSSILNVTEHALRLRISRELKLPKEGQRSLEDLTFGWEAASRKKRQVKLPASGKVLTSTKVGKYKISKLANLQPECLAKYEKHGEAVLKSGTKVFYKGELITLRDLAREKEMSFTTLLDRICQHKGATMEDLVDNFDKFDKRKHRDKDYKPNPYVVVHGRKVHISKAAELLGVTVNTLYRYRRKYGVDYDLSKVTKSTYDLVRDNCGIMQVP